MKRNHILLIGLILILGVVAYLVLQRPGESSIQSSERALLIQYDSLAIDRMEVTSQFGQVVIEKKAGEWMISQPVSYRADRSAVMDAITKGASMRTSGIISSNPDKQTTYQVDSTAPLVKMFEKGTVRASFRVGKPGSSFNETYVRLDESDDVYLVNEMLTQVYTRQVKDWRDKAIFRSTRESVSSVSFRYGDTTFTLSKLDTIWTVDGQPANMNAISAFLAAITGFMSDEFIDVPPATTPSNAGTIDIDGTQILFFSGPDPAKLLVQTSVSPQWFEVQSWRASQVLKRKKVFQTSS